MIIVFGLVPDTFKPYLAWESTRVNP